MFLTSPNWLLASSSYLQKVPSGPLCRRNGSALLCGPHYLRKYPFLFLQNGVTKLALPSLPTELMDIESALGRTTCHIYKHRIYLLVSSCSFMFPKEDSGYLSEMLIIPWAKNRYCGAGEMGQQLRALAALSEY